MEKRLGSLLLALVMVLTLLPAFTTGAAAEDTNSKKLYIASDAEQGYTVLGSENTFCTLTGGGTAEFCYNAICSTLWLEDYQADGSAGYLKDNNLCGIYYYGNLEIILCGGENWFGMQRDSGEDDYVGIYGIYVAGNLIITCEESIQTSLDVWVDDDLAAKGESCGIYCGGSLSISENECSVLSVETAGGRSGNSLSAGVETEQGIEMDSGTLTATGGTAKEMGSFGIVSSGESLISGTAVIRATGGISEGSSIGTRFSKLTLTGGTVTATGGTGINSYGFYCDELEASGGTLTAQGGEASGHSYGILGGSSLALAPTDGFITAYGHTRAISNAGVTAPVLMVGNEENGSDAVLADMYGFSDTWHYARLDARDYAFGAAVSGTTLSWRAKLPSGVSTRAIAAWYDTSGRMLGAAASGAITANGVSDGTFTVGGDAAVYRLFLLNGTGFAPLGAAWSSGE